MLQYGVTQIQYNIRRMNPYKLDTKFEDFNSKNMSDDVNICEYNLYDRYEQVYTFVLIIKDWIQNI